MLTDLWMLGSQDSRYMRIFQDVLNEVKRAHIGETGITGSCTLTATV